eukprot:TRINITY_DN1265_c0_g1_i1.p1 TRINITY_DN1265_c0_g1~~TRINITY_DN1265_c0_g1_i1.p1  ORF type:complete len:782 (+),score=175.07 TRINITY_DN1265_c0_g1_i1:206-2551(+)
MDMLKQGYGMVVDTIIRPPRHTYNPAELGPARFRVARKVYSRTDLVVRNERGLALECSHFEPAPENRPREALPCVIYLHGNCGCRLDAFECLETLLPYNIQVFAFDFSGSGNSEGDYVSLGHFEKQDVDAVVQHLRGTGRVSRIGLWGRSMGAVTSIMYSKTDPSISCCVLDSPFASLSRVAVELVESSEARIPKTMVKVGLRVIRSTIKKKAKFDLDKLEPIAAVKKCFVPALFIHGQGDSFIRPKHSEDLFQKYAGDKNILLVEGDHNSERPEFCRDSVSIFFNNHLLVGEDAYTEEEMNLDDMSARLPSLDGFRGGMAPFGLPPRQPVDYDDYFPTDALAAIAASSAASQDEEFNRSSFASHPSLPTLNSSADGVSGGASQDQNSSAGATDASRRAAATDLEEKMLQEALLASLHSFRLAGSNDSVPEVVVRDDMCDSEDGGGQYSENRSENTAESGPIDMDQPMDMELVRAMRLSLLDATAGDESVVDNDLISSSSATTTTTTTSSTCKGHSAPTTMTTSPTTTENDPVCVEVSLPSSSSTMTITETANSTAAHTNVNFVDPAAREVGNTSLSPPLQPSPSSKKRRKSRHRSKSCQDVPEASPSSPASSSSTASSTSSSSSSSRRRRKSNRSSSSSGEVQVSSSDRSLDERNGSGRSRRRSGNSSSGGSAGGSSRKDSVEDNARRHRRSSSSDSQSSGSGSGKSSRHRGSERNKSEGRSSEGRSSEGRSGSSNSKSFKSTHSCESTNGDGSSARNARSSNGDRESGVADDGDRNAVG